LAIEYPAVGVAVPLASNPCREPNNCVDVVLRLEYATLGSNVVGSILVLVAAVVARAVALAVRTRLADRDRRLVGGRLAPEYAAAATSDNRRRRPPTAASAKAPRAAAARRDVARL
jgi:hypothetical protein